MHTIVDKVPTLLINPESVTMFSSSVYVQDCRYNKRNVRLVEQSKEHNGKVSHQAQRKLKKAIRYLIFLAQPKSVFCLKSKKVVNFRVSFITLTLASQQIHSDNDIKKLLLNQLLIELHKHYKVNQYVWKAEKQANGNIHFHILIDKYVDWSELRDMWNRIQNKLGYVDRYRDRMRKFFAQGFKVRPELLHKWSYKDQLNAYNKGQATSWNSPNSTDIHSVKSIKHLSNYVIKYMCKSSQNQGLKGRLWGCSTNLSNIKGASLDVDSDVAKEVEFIRSQQVTHIVDEKYYSVFCVNIFQLARTSIPLIFTAITEFLFNQFNYSYQLLIT